MLDAAARASPLLRGLRCRECGREYPVEPVHVCEHCFGPLEVAYAYDEIARRISRQTISRRAPNLWRYRELLPLAEAPTVGLEAGFTPLVAAPQLGRALGHLSLYVKNDGVSHPSLSFKDRVVAVAMSKAREFGFDTVACASTGNLANSTAAHAAQAGLKCYVFIPSGLEAAKVLGTTIFGARVICIDGTYDEANRLCSEVAGRYRWAFVNVNLRPFYAEGSKSYGFEVQEQLGWKAPAHLVVPMASGSLLVKIGKSLDEFRKLGLVEAGGPTRLHGAQPSGCSPIAEAVLAERDVVKPVRKPATIAKSLAIGDPADGHYAIRAIRDSGGWAAAVGDREIVEAMRLLAETEGIFTETAGGVTVAAARRLIAEGRIPPDEPTVVCITGNGLKTQEALAAELPAPPVIPPRLEAFERIL